MSSKRLSSLWGSALLLAALLAPAVAQVPVPPQVTIQGAPPVPEELAAAMAPYTEIRTATLAAWHPARHEMLIATRFGSTTQLHLVQAPGGARRQLTFFGDPVEVASFQPGAGDYFIFQRDSDGTEQIQLYRFDVATGRVSRLSEGTARYGLGTTRQGVWSPDGDRLAFVSTRRTGKLFDLYTMDPLRPETARLVAEADRGGLDPIDWSADGRWILALERLSSLESHLWRVEVATGARTLIEIAGAHGPAAITEARFSADGRSLFVISDTDSEFRRLARVDLESGRLTSLSDHIDWDVQEFRLSPGGGTIALVSNEDGVGVLRLIDTVAGAEHQLPALPPGIVSGVQWHPSGTALAFTFEWARSPRDVYALDLESGRLTQWTFSEVGGLNPETFSLPELVRWPSFDGLTISGFYLRPAPRFKGPRPVVINIHGGPAAQSRPIFMGRGNYWLDELGVAVIWPNIRGSLGYGRTFLTLDDGMRRADAVKDIVALVEWIRQQPELDADRIMVFGGSYGGYVALAMAAFHGDLVRCVFSGSGISNLVTHLERTAPVGQAAQRAEYR
jgi:dipeptidyl aminopeptidase/acylaminoacyl peptidase